MREPHNGEGAAAGTPFAGFLTQLAQGAAALRRAPNAHFRRPLPPEPPAPGTVAHMEASMRWARTLPDVKDYRSDARQEIDRVWAGFDRECRERSGLVPSLDPAGLEAGAAIALRRAREAEAAYLGLQGASHAGGTSVAAARTKFVATVAKFANAATAGWPSARERAARIHLEGRMR